MTRTFEALDFQGKFINSGFLEAFASGISPVASADLGSTMPSAGACLVQPEVA